MRVEVKLHGLLRPHHPGPNRSTPLPVELADRATPRDVVQALRLPEGLARIVFVNDQQSSLDAPLADGDRVALFTVVVGGAFVR
jgi:molybdopterin converting factor small subunit